MNYAVTFDGYYTQVFTGPEAREAAELFVKYLAERGITSSMGPVVNG